MNKINFWPFGEHRRITSVVGDREYMYKGELVKDFHKGWDAGTPLCSKIGQPEDGGITTGFDKAFGYWVVLRGKHYRWNFWHLASSPKIIRNSNLSTKTGMHLAETGNSGMSTAPHCHMQIAKAGSESGSYIDPFDVFTDEVLATLEFPEGVAWEPNAFSDPSIQLEYPEANGHDDLIIKLGDLIDDIQETKSQAETIMELVRKERR